MTPISVKKSLNIILFRKKSFEVFKLKNFHQPFGPHFPAIFCGTVDLSCVESASSALLHLESVIPSTLAYQKIGALKKPFFPPEKRRWQADKSSLLIGECRGYIFKCLFSCCHVSFFGRVWKFVKNWILGDFELIFVPFIHLGLL